MKSWKPLGKKYSIQKGKEKLQVQVKEEEEK
eukprot:CAMPEP_0114362032 /NCGR_PEP_ID=MMETSP0101-20121206/25288_1 /TAXON_ID=38822 ORGANISM="Pteridomonas danica, Strain PT" /NCGR_SAMPLE_ID=MMETSP0101 /ASSEMBLY_ACC=CAM_ASM_000211 /LENGTH=30 /DNA_ID= /DNA_START= /DNA_END= /DNA_ORIENTATION=